MRKQATVLILEKVLSLSLSVKCVELETAIACIYKPHHQETIRYFSATCKNFYIECAKGT